MTIIVGIICEDGLVIASDSQASSFRGVDVKRLDYTKIYSFGFDGAKVVLTGAGQVPFIIRAREIIEDKSKDQKFHGPRAIADIAEDTMIEISRRYIVERLRGLGSVRGPGQSDDGPMSAPDFALFLGVHCGTEPCLYTVYPDGVAGREDRYASLGSGSAFAEYLLARLYRDGLDLEEAVRIAVYVVEEVKKVEPHCGGPTQIVVLSAGEIIRKSEAQVRDIVQSLEEYDSSLKRVWKEIVEGPRQAQTRPVTSARTESLASAEPRN